MRQVIADSMARAAIENEFIERLVLIALIDGDFQLETNLNNAYYKAAADVAVVKQGGCV